MSEPFGWFTTVGTIATAIGVIVVGFLRYRDRRETARENHEATLAAEAAKIAVEEAAAKLVLIDGKIVTLGKAVDGRLSALIAALEKNADLRVTAALAKGRLEGGEDRASEQAAAVEGGRRADDAEEAS